MASRNSSGGGPKPVRALGVFVLVVGALVATMAGLRTWTPKLGLDLAGGTTVTLTPVTQQGGDAPDELITQAVQIIRKRVNALGVSEAEVTKQGDNIVVAVPGANRKELAKQVGQTAQLRFRQVLALKSTTATAQPSDSSSADSSKSASPDQQSPGSDSASSSPDSSGSSEESSDQSSGQESSSSTPSPSTASSAALGAGDAGNTVAVSPVLAAKPVTASTSSTPSASGSSSRSEGDSGSSDNGQDTQGSHDGQGEGGKPEPSSSPTAARERTEELMQQVRQRTQGIQGKTSDIDKDVLKKFKNFECKPGQSRGRLLPKNQQVVACNEEGTTKFVLDEAKVLGTMVVDAQAALPGQGQTGGWMVTLEFNGEGTKKFGDLTQRVANLSPPRNRVAVVLDGVVQSAPTIQEPILGGSAQITGDFTAEEARDLATILRYGSLPLKFKDSEYQHISASLAASNLRAGLIAGAIGMALVVLYSVLYYRALGLVAVFGLFVALAISYSAIVVLGTAVGYRLSLAGIVGMIVSIGITVDSFVIYFERLRDELREGRTVRAAVEYGWTRARRTILTSDAVSLLAAAVLWIVAVGGVKGFAFTLGLTTLLDTVVVFLFTKPILTVLARTRFFGEGHPLSGVDPRTLGASRTTRAGSAKRSGSTKAREA